MKFNVKKIISRIDSDELSFQGFRLNTHLAWKTKQDSWFKMKNL